MLIQGEELVIHPDHRALFAGLARIDDIFEEWLSLPPGPIPDRSWVEEVELPSGRFFLKVYAYRGLWRLRTVFIQSRARREYRNLLRMAELGFRVPQPVAYAQRRMLGFVSRSFVMTRAVDNAVDLRSLIDRGDRASLPPSPERRRLIEEFARTLRRAHDEKFFVHTLRAKNLLLSRDGDRWSLHVIDVPFAGIGRYRLFPEWGRVRDLAVLMKWARQLLSRTERMRFARTYGAGRELLRRAQSYQERHYP